MTVEIGNRRFVLNTKDATMSTYEEILEEGLYGKRGPVHCHITNVGLYTLVVKENLSGGISPGVFVNKHPVWPLEFIKAREMISTSDGSILYFDEKIDSYFKEGSEVIIYCRGANYVNGKNNGTLWKDNKNINC